MLLLSKTPVISHVSHLEVSQNILSQNISQQIPPKVNYLSFPIDIDNYILYADNSLLFIYLTFEAS